MTRPVGSWLPVVAHRRDDDVRPMTGTGAGEDDTDAHRLRQRSVIPDGELRSPRRLRAGLPGAELQMIDPVHQRGDGWRPAPRDPVAIMRRLADFQSVPIRHQQRCIRLRCRHLRGARRQRGDERHRARVADEVCRAIGRRGCARHRASWARRV